MHVPTFSAKWKVKGESDPSRGCETFTASPSDNVPYHFASFFNRVDTIAGIGGRNVRIKLG
jgi:hypothetical protein